MIIGTITTCGNVVLVFFLSRKRVFYREGEREKMYRSEFLKRDRMKYLNEIRGVGRRGGKIQSLKRRGGKYPARR